MKIVAFVPIKLNSERLANKNIKPFSNGKLLTHYIFSTLENVADLDEVYVYCSEQRIIKYIPQRIHFLCRESYLDLPTTSFNEVLTSFAMSVDADIYVLAHTTAPFIRAESIEAAIQKVKSGEYDSALAVTKMQDFLWRDGKPFNYDPKNIPRTQDLKPIYKETCGLYIYTKDVITNQKRRIGEHPYLLEVSKKEAFDINDEEDFMIADAICMRGLYE